MAEIDGKGAGYSQGEETQPVAEAPPVSDSKDEETKKDVPKSEGADSEVGQPPPPAAPSAEEEEGADSETAQPALPAAPSAEEVGQPPPQEEKSAEELAEEEAKKVAEAKAARREQFLIAQRGDSEVASMQTLDPDAPDLCGWIGVQERDERDEFGRNEPRMDMNFNPRWMVLSGRKLSMSRYEDETYLSVRGCLEETIVNIGEVSCRESSGSVAPHWEKRQLGFTFETAPMLQGNGRGPTTRRFFNVGNSASLANWMTTLHVQSMKVRKDTEKEIKLSGDSSSSPMAGWLGKRGASSTAYWRPRWCVVEGSSLAYYEDDLMKKSKGKIELLKASLVESFQSSEAISGDVFQHRQTKPYGFTLDTNPAADPDRRIYYFNAGNEKTMQAWMEAIQKAAVSSLA